MLTCLLKRRLVLCAILGVVAWAAGLATSGTAVAQGSVRIVALGASNTYGKGVSRAQAYPAQLQGLLKQRGVSAVVVNAGINGDTTGGMLARLSSAVPAGGNDRRAGGEGERASNIAKIRSQLSARGVTVVMMENSALAAVPSSERAADGIHFTPRGYAILAQNILPQVLAAVGK
jgi:acyl-CoA thioesterase-1